MSKLEKLKLMDVDDAQVTFDGKVPVIRFSHEATRRLNEPLRFSAVAGLVGGRLSIKGYCFLRFNGHINNFCEREEHACMFTRLRDEARWTLNCMDKQNDTGFEEVFVFRVDFAAKFERFEARDKKMSQQATTKDIGSLRVELSEIGRSLRSSFRCIGARH
ncbi:hypothetical protein EJ110_NYTH11366 [Nymphaea thermarum]|nr:hypothetical protein EJ110_NYTH11366 [Nymphaea thermarum]